MDKGSRRAASSPAAKVAPQAARRADSLMRRRLASRQQGDNTQECRQGVHARRRSASLPRSVATEVAILNERFAVAVLLVVRQGGVKLCQRAPAVAVHDALVIQQP